MRSLVLSVVSDAHAFNTQWDRGSMQVLRPGQPVAFLLALVGVATRKRESPLHSLVACTSQAFPVLRASVSCTADAHQDHAPASPLNLPPSNDLEAMSHQVILALRMFDFDFEEEEDR
eukprot:1332339-Rhodomonas_salina.1